ncbi:transporter substrate-binding domain-containing protein [Roseibium denhamense]|uniref:Extracellular solute-binding protein, family 3 n=1 Tax=Roseibium denhamense TaxID=76305 RepID=A0ABY1N6Q6_9HYPH|nr:transporter substrate-binding domain-containing protein [Roseibium denhamense]MTI06065.1 transporter substrate-binding domain-containing protein [Roseibium denhamense]SMP01556.1 extracellular solute-binding protein, family 3 [Roseibium denhamense]
MRRWVFAIGLLLWPSVLLPVKAAEPLKFSTIQDSTVSAVAAAIVSRAYEALGIGIEIYPTSGTRAITLAVKGAVDGDLVRISAVPEKHPVLIPIEIPGFALEGAIFVRRQDAGRFERGLPHDAYVGYQKGVILSERIAKSFENTWAGETERELFVMLQERRLDAVISDTIDGTLLVAQLCAHNLVALGGSVEAVQFYHLLHERNKGLAPQVGGALKRLYETGETKQIIQSELSSKKAVCG